MSGVETRTAGEVNLTAAASAVGPASAADFALPVRVYWEDTDAGGIVFYANYLKFFERARSEWLRALGVQQQALRERTGGMFVVVQTALRYRAPARLDDLLRVTATLQHAGQASLTIAQQAWRDPAPGAHHAAAPVLLCEGTIRIGWVEGATLSPARIPTAILEVLQP